MWSHSLVIVSFMYGKYFYERFEKVMFEIIQEAALPKLSQTDLYSKYDASGQLTACVKTELVNASQYTVKPSDIQELIALMKLNGDGVVKKAVAAYEKGDIIILNNTTTSSIPAVLPFIVINTKTGPRAYVFANKCMNNIKSNAEYTNLMAVLEAAFLALCLQVNPNKFTHNRSLVLTLCDLYVRMATAPLEQKLYMKGDNLTKTLLMMIAFFYKTIDGVANPAAIPYGRIIKDNVDKNTFKSITDSVNRTKTFMDLIALVKTINPVRYKNLEGVYISHFTAVCGASLIFALENPAYLFLLVPCANYKCALTAYGLNKMCGPITRKVTPLLMQSL